MQHLLTNEGHDFIYIYLLNLSTGQIVVRLWELKGSTLLSDQKVYLPDMVNPPGNINLAEWSQPLVGEGLIRERNKSLASIIDRFERKIPKGVNIDIHSGEC